MKKNNWTLALFLLVGLVAGTIVSQLLVPMHSLDFLTNSTQIAWHPKGDLKIVKYDLDIQVKLNLVSLLGLLGGWWLFRKL